MQKKSKKKKNLYDGKVFYVGWSDAFCSGCPISNTTKQTDYKSGGQR